MKNTRILIVDDHNVLCQCVEMLLGKHLGMDVVGTAFRGEEACRLVGELKPDVVVMDLMMPGLGGAAATKRLKEMHPQTKVVIFSSHEDEVYMRQAFNCGASGYVIKAAAVDELAQAIKAVAAGGIYLSSRLAKEIAAQSRTASGPDGNLLSVKETDLVRLSAQGLTNKEIAHLMGMSIKSIETYKTRVNKKMHFESRVDLVRYAVTRGLLHNESQAA